MKPANRTRAGGFVVAADEGQPFWFLNTLTITKVGSGHSHGLLSILDHRVPPGFAPPPHLHHQTDEALLVLDGQLNGSAGTTHGRPGPARWCSCPAPSRTASPSPTPGRAGSSSWPARAASTSSSRPPANQPRTCACPYPSRPTRPASHN